MMNVLVIGSGGREHALCWKLKQSPLLKKLYCAPGNAGIAQVAERVVLNEADHAAVISFCKEKKIDLVMIGPEAPLVVGLADSLSAAGIPCCGPSAKAAQLEGSKDFTKQIAVRANAPTAAYGTFTDAKSAREYILKHGAPIVVKADGLAAGKGVTVAMTEEEAIAAVEDIASGIFGKDNTQILVEEFLEGEELSFFALADGENAVSLGFAQDHKRVFDGDTGPNTGGMGTYSPCPAGTDALQSEVMARIIYPVLRVMAQQGTPFRGVLFAGLMLTKKGVQLLEFNTRFGDPETQVLMPRIDADLLPLLLGAATSLKGIPAPAMKRESALCVVMASKGYPGTYQKGTEIRGIDHASQISGVTVFHAGTEAKDGKTIATGGRVLGVTALASNLEEAQTRAYKAVDALDWPEGFCRRDIGWRALKSNAA